MKDEDQEDGQIHHERRRGGNAGLAIGAEVERSRWQRPSFKTQVGNEIRRSGRTQERCWNSQHLQCDAETEEQDEVRIATDLRLLLTE